jgi:alkylation response protein AidB-like acyl-CoA dehydrogenase
MEFDLNERQRELQQKARHFAETELAPHVDRWEATETIEAPVLRKVGAEGLLGALVRQSHGGGQLDMISYGLINEEIGRVCPSIGALITAHNMVASAIDHWGTPQQKQQWLKDVATGQIIGAFCLTEPNAGSDAAGIESAAVACDSGYVLNGRKRWISFAQAADTFLIFARLDGKPSAFIIDRGTPGLSITGISGMSGLRAAMLADLDLVDCHIPKHHLIGRAGLGLSHVAALALSHGRYSVAWSCVGIAQACLNDTLRYISVRRQFGVLLKEHQSIQRLIAKMVVSVRAARLVCLHAGWLKDRQDPEAINETCIAKYLASISAVQVANDAVQIQGAAGCRSGASVERLSRDARIMEIIEGTTQIQEVLISRRARLSDYSFPRGDAPYPAVVNSA